MTDASSEESAPAQADPEDASHRAYWRANVRLLLVLMAVWFLASFGAGILFRDFLDQWSIGGYPLGFWFAQQGSIYVFLVLIAIYVAAMRRIDHNYCVDDD